MCIRDRNNAFTFVNYSQAAYTPTTDADGNVVKSFYENVRDAFGIGYSDTIQTDAFAPSQYSLDMFTADELLNNGSSVVNYYGYDYKGNVENSNSWNLNNFYTDKGDDGNNIRRIDAFRPTYIAGFVQDRFTFDDVIFNIGVRIDPVSYTHLTLPTSDLV